MDGELASAAAAQHGGITAAHAERDLVLQAHQIEVRHGRSPVTVTVADREGLDDSEPLSGRSTGARPVIAPSCFDRLGDRGAERAHRGVRLAHGVGLRVLDLRAPAAADGVAVGRE